MTRYGRKRRRLADLTARDIDEMRERHDSVELERHDAEQMEREPADDRFERQQARWLTPIDSDDFKSAA